ncbi:WD40 repeat-containing protein HOS15-like isoform X1 [Vitis riparia]|uniref:WD40 repeat-containing protein HOS15-like isoform X1 n=2 Tax=Vitis riparia TaxID=96939 RepID=UPI00155A22F4|nr:WD40 repeat-containing protein HOS15-like isoform X1 [Vitis riparia]
MCDTTSESMGISTRIRIPHGIIPCDVATLAGHTDEVVVCAWNPTCSLLASGSHDSTARIWTIVDGACNSTLQDVVVLTHAGAMTVEDNGFAAICELDWKGDGTLLATGSCTGETRIWTPNGALVASFEEDMGHIVSLQWNQMGNSLLSCGSDKVIVWDINTVGSRQEFSFHSARILDADWRNNISFATCSADRKIHVCEVGLNRPYKTFLGHRAEINGIRWSPTGALLASCSDDTSIKIWSMNHNSFVRDLKSHKREVYCIEWSPTGPTTDNPNLTLLLASSSFDNTINVWDVERGNPIYGLTRHRNIIYTIEFSPNGEYLASGSLDNWLYVWSVKEGRLIKSYYGGGGVTDISWNKSSDKIAVSFVNKLVCVLDIKM